MRREFGVNEMVKESSRLKTQVNEVEGIMKETLELVDKFQADLDEANASKLVLENRERSAEDQVALLHRQVLELQAQAEGAQVASTKVVELEAEMQETVAQDGEMFIQG